MFAVALKSLIDHMVEPLRFMRTYLRVRVHLRMVDAWFADLRKGRRRSN